MVNPVPVLAAIPGFSYLRKLWHLSGLLIPAILYYDLLNWTGWQTRSIGILLLAAALLLLITFDLIRFRIPSFNSFVIRYLGFMMKEEEASRFNGIIPYFIASLFLLLFFSKVAVIVGMIFLSIGDPAAAIIGSKFGSRRFQNGKSLEGLVAFIIAGTLFALAFFYLQSLDPAADFAWHSGSRFVYGCLLVVCGAAAAAIAEFFSGTSFRGFIDDNLLVPLAGAIAFALIGFYGFGLPTDAFFFDPARLY